MATGNEPLATWVVEFDGSAAASLDKTLSGVDQSLSKLDKDAKRTGDSITSAMVQAEREAYKFAAALKFDVVDPSKLANFQAPKVGGGLTESAAKKFAAGVQAPKVDESAAKAIASAGAVEKAWLKVGAGAAAAAGLAFAAGKMVADSVISFARAGFQGTAEAARMATTMQLISREMANAFAPAIRFVNDVLSRFLGTLKNMTAESQKAISVFGGIAAGAGSGFMLGGPIGAVVGAFASLFMTTEKGRASLDRLFEKATPVLEQIMTTFEEMLPAMEALIPVMEALASGTLRVISGLAHLESFINPFAGIGRLLSLGSEQSRSPRDQLNNRGGGFESLASTWERIQSAINKSDIAQRQLQTLQRIEENTRGRRWASPVEQPGGPAAEGQPARAAGGMRHLRNQELAGL